MDAETEDLMNSPVGEARDCEGHTPDLTTNTTPTIVGLEKPAVPKSTRTLRPLPHRRKDAETTLEPDIVINSPVGVTCGRGKRLTPDLSTTRIMPTTAGPKKPAVPETTRTLRPLPHRRRSP